MTLDYKQILHNFLAIIDGISDKDYQERVWIRGEGLECDDFDESTCFFFDMGDPILENYNEYSISESQYYLLIKFREVFRQFSDNHHWPPDFIDSPEWAKIMQMAKEVLVAFNYKK